MTPEEYEDAITDLVFRTPSIDTYRRAMAYSNNFVWHIQTGDLVNLLEEALEELEGAQRQVDKVEQIHRPISDTYMGRNMRPVDPRCSECGTRWPCRTILLMRDALDG
jgi:hypothetical protein